jgi:hypothetical protein
MDEITKKRCPKCDKVKLAKEFSKNKSKKYGLEGWCKLCCKDKKRKRYQENREVILSKVKTYRQENREAILYKQSKYRQENREAILYQKRKRYQENREAILYKKRKRYQENREVILSKVKTYLQENREAILYKKSKYRQENREAILYKQSKYYQENREAMQKRSASGRQNLSDSYVKGLIYAQTTIPLKQIPEKIIQLKREQLTVRRLIKEINNGLN